MPVLVLLHAGAATTAAAAVGLHWGDGREQRVAGGHRRQAVVHENVLQLA